MSDALHFVIASRDDAERLAVFAKKAFCDAYEAQNDPEHFGNFVADAFSVNRIGAELSDPSARTYLRCLRGDLVGYVTVRGGASAECVVSDRPFELQRIYVDKRHANGGLGSQLLDAAIEHATSAKGDCLWLGVWERNHGAQRFYRRHGFVEIGEHGFMLGPERQRDVIMALTIS